MTADRVLALSELPHQRLALLASGLEERVEELTEALRNAEQFVTGNMKLDCLPSESDRECFDRSRQEMIVRVQRLLAKHSKEP